MRGEPPSPAQIRSRLILAARWIVIEHSPDVEGRCPVCRIADCHALQTAQSYLNAVDAYQPGWSVPAPGRLPACDPGHLPAPNPGHLPAPNPGHLPACDSGLTAAATWETQRVGPGRG